MPRNWRITAHLLFPMEVVDGEGKPVTGGLPKQLNWSTRIVESTREYGGIVAHFRRARSHGSLVPTPSNLYGAFVEPAELHFETTADDPQSALIKVEGLLESISDDLAFRLQFPLRIPMLEIFDVTPPLEEGQPREMVLFPYPNGFSHLKFMLSAHLGGILTERSPNLTTANSTANERARAALRWFHKALAAQFELDRFVFYWIVLEILCAHNGKTVQRNYKNKCGHEIEKCPSCGISTSRRVNGPTLIAFLRDDLGVSETDAEGLWKFRQLVHGKNELTREKNEELTKNCVRLRAAVTLGLKKQLGISAAALPLVAPQGVTFSTSIALCGTRNLTCDDIQNTLE